jgi:hypothetical protein
VRYAGALGGRCGATSRTDRKHGSQPRLTALPRCHRRRGRPKRMTKTRSYLSRVDSGTAPRCLQAEPVIAIVPLQENGAEQVKHVRGPAVLLALVAIGLLVSSGRAMALRCCASATLPYWLRQRVSTSSDTARRARRVAMQAVNYPRHMRSIHVRKRSWTPRARSLDTLMS